MPDQVHILSMGQMVPSVDAALQQPFVVHQADADSIAAIVTAFGNNIRGIATRGRQKTAAAGGANADKTVMSAITACKRMNALSLLKSLSGLGIGLAIATDDF
jgi:hypothetical protein